MTATVHDVAHRVIVVVAALLLAAATDARGQSPFAAAVAPSPAVIQPGGSTVLTVSTTAGANFREDIVYAINGLPAGISAGAPRAVSHPYPPATFTLQAAAGVAPGTYTAILTGQASSGSVTVPFTLTVPTPPPPPPPAPPVIRHVAPATLASGTRHNVIRMTGENFASDASLHIVGAGMQLVSARVLSPTAAEATITVREDAAAGTYRVELRNPGTTPPAIGAVTVRRAASLASPLAIVAARIVSPRASQIVADDAVLYARAIVATSGMGTVTGTWLLDGVPFERFTRTVTGGMPLELRSTLPIPAPQSGEQRLELVFEQPHTQEPTVIRFFRARDSRTALRVLEPAAGTFAQTETLELRWTLVPGATAYDVVLDAAVDAEAAPSPRALRHRTATTAWRPPAAAVQALGADRLRIQVTAIFPGGVRAETTPWHAFSLGSPPDGEPGEAPPGLGGGARQPPREPVPVPAPRGTVALSASGATTAAAADFEQPPPLTRLQLSVQTDAAAREFTHQATADLSASHELRRPLDAHSESRHWITSLEAATAGIATTIVAGYTPPAHFDGAELLAITRAGTGVRALLDAGAARLAYYRSVDMGSIGAFDDMAVDAAAFVIDGAGGRVRLRALGLHARETAHGPGDVGDASGSGSAAGVLANVDLGETVQLEAEAAFGRITPGENALDSARSGAALRVDALGRAAGIDYRARFAHTSQDFVNPADPGFTPAGFSDRTHAELAADHAWRGARFGAVAHAARGGIARGSGDPHTIERGMRLNAHVPIQPSLSIDVRAGFAAQHGDAPPDSAMHATDRTQRSAEATVVHRLGVLTLQHSATWSTLNDAVEPVFDQDVTGISSTVSGAATPFLTLSAAFSATRILADTVFGNTDQVLFSAQPTLHLDAVWLRFTPRAVFGRDLHHRNDDIRTTELYHLGARWNPPWAAALLALEVTTRWQRTRSALAEQRPPFQTRSSLTLSLNWRADRRWP